MKTVIFETTNTGNLCAVCKNCFATCNSKHTFGDGAGKDNVISCDSFKSSISPRRSGKTTRFVDDAIQALFKTGRCYYNETRNVTFDNEVRSKILNRLSIEHPHIKTTINFEYQYIELMDKDCQ